MMNWSHQVHFQQTLTYKFTFQNINCICMGRRFTWAIIYEKKLSSNTCQRNDFILWFPYTEPGGWVPLRKNFLSKPSNNSKGWGTDIRRVLSLSGECRLGTFWGPFNCETGFPCVVVPCHLSSLLTQLLLLAIDKLVTQVFISFLNLWHAPFQAFPWFVHAVPSA